MIRAGAFLVMLLTILIGGFSKPAQAGTNIVFPDNFAHKYWAAMNCQYIEQYFYHTPEHVLTITRDGALLTRLTKFEPFGTDYYYLETPRFAHLVQIQGPERYDMIIMPGTLNTLNPETIDQRTDIFPLTYHACGSLETQSWAWEDSVIDPDGLALFYDMEDLLKTCRAGNKENFAQNTICHDALLKRFDINGDQALDYGELIKSYRALLYIVAAASCDFPGIYRATTDMASRRFADEMLNLVDRNHDGAVNLKEIKARWPAFAGSERLAEFIRQIETLYTVFPVLPPAPAHFSCTSCAANPEALQ